VNVDVVRDTAVGVLLRVFEQDAYLAIALDRALRRKPVSQRGRRFLTHLVYGTVRYKLLCDFILERLVHEPLDKLPPAIRAVLRMGVFQALFCKQVTFPSMVHTSVDLARRRGHAGVARLANAVLRRAPRDLSEVPFPDRARDPAAYLSLRYSMPRWLIEEWISEHGEAGTEALCCAFNREAPTTIRVNTLKATPEQLAADLGQAGYAPRKLTPIPEELTLDRGLPPANAKLFSTGCFMIQDPASMLPPHLLEPEPGQRVLDLCAAPGGKTTHIAQLAGDNARVVALDIHPARLGLVRENTDRLGVTCVSPLCGDGTAPPLRPQFDRVLVDAPCSGLGTLRRHPDLKWRADPAVRESLGRLQARLLRSGVEFCKNGGLIVYSVCTTTRRETLAVVRAVLETERVEPEDGPEWLDPWKIDRGRYQTHPAEEELDGFFLTRLRKVS
jgi:16S rRNA (cytosine967-C5)-methyltransferase